MCATENLLARYTEACNYPGVLDELKVESELARYLKALGVSRKIVRLRCGWSVYEHPDLLQQMRAVISDFLKRGGYARDAMAAMDAMDARDAMDAMDAMDVIGTVDEWC